MGTTTASRRLPPLQPGWLRVDPRTPRQLLAATVPTAALFNFFDETGTPRGRWDAFFSGLPVIRYARLAELDSAGRARFFRAALRKLPRRLNPPDASEFAGAWGVIDRLFQLFLHVDAEARWFAGRPDESGYAASLEHAITGVLREKYHVAGYCGRWLARMKKVAPFGLALPAGGGFQLATLRSDWWNPTAETVGKEESLSLESFATLLTDAAWTTHATVRQLSDAAGVLFDRHYAAPTGLPPHFALYLAFLRQFTGAQEVLNRLPARHRDHYYRDVLGLAPAAAVPDRTFVSFQGAPGARIDLPAGAGLLAGKDGAGRAVVYRITAPLAVNPVKLARIATTWLRPPVVAGRAGFFAAGQAASADGAGAPLAPGTGWVPFGEDQSGKLPGERTMADASTGFAISSPALHLEEGIRYIRLAIRFVTPETPARVEPNQWLAEPPWAVEYSGAKAWVTVAPERCSFAVSLGRDGRNQPMPLKMTVVIRLPAGAPACVNCNPEVLGPGFDARVPALLLRCTDPLRAFGEATAFAEATVQSVEVIVAVRGMRDLILAGPSGRLPAGQPAPPFGFPPQAGARLVLGKTELFRKQLASLHVGVTWQGLPTSRENFPRGLSDYYADYLVAVTNPAPEMFRNDQYQVKFSVLNGSTWDALPPDRAPLFDWEADPDDPTVGPLNPVSEWDWPRLPPGLLPVSPGLGGPLEYGPSATIGFIGVELDAPDYLFGHALYPSVVTALALENAAVFTRAARRPTPSAGELDPPSAFNLIKVRASWWRRNVRDTLRKGPAWEINPAILKQMETHAASFPKEATAPRSPAEAIATLKQLNHVVFFDRAGLQDLISKKLGLPATPAGRAARDKIIFWLAAVRTGPAGQHPAVDAAPSVIQGIPPPPLSPMISGVEIRYAAKSEITVANSSGPAPAWDRLWHFAPLMPAPRPVVPGGTRLLPVTPPGGCLHLGFEGVEPPETISLLFVLAEAPVFGEAVADNEPRWSCLVGDEWIDSFATAVHDGTEGFRRSGIVRLDLPVGAGTAHTVMPAGLVWIRAQVPSPSPTLRVLRLLLNAAEADWSPPAELSPTAMAEHFANPLAAGSVTGLEVSGFPIQKIDQPLPGFGGVPSESDSAFAIRVSERLRHKGRAVTARDYEQLILQLFPTVFSARVIRPLNGAQAGSITIVVLPRLAAPPVLVPPGFTPGELLEMERALQALAPITARAKLSVRNPRYELLAVKARVRFAPDRSFAHQRARLAGALNAFISPWIYRQESVIDPFASFNASEFGALVRRQSYVLDVGLVEVLKDGVALDVLAPASAGALLLAAPDHLIEPLEP